jgi:hypothetical protein
MDMQHKRKGAHTTMKTTKTTAKKTAAKATKPTTKKAAAPKAAKPAKVAKPAAEKKTSRKDTIIALISRPGGATLAEIMKTTEWQKHSVRGMISILGKTMEIASTKNDAGDRTYIAGNAPKAAPAKKAAKVAKPKAAKPAPTAPVDAPAA